MDDSKKITVLKALSTEARLKIMNILAAAKDSLTVESIAGVTEMRHSVASMHLKILHQAELVNKTHSGRYVLYTVNDLMIDQVCLVIGQLKQQKETA